MTAAPAPTAATPLTGDALQRKLACTPVLCVGAGGIGCELLKTLVLAGFRLIDVIDLDTIDVSNLNRQFLFRRAHVGSPKAVVAAAAAARLAPAGATFEDGVSPVPPPVITPHHGDVRSASFGLDFFKRFAVVLNGLDNLDARRHVNRLCLAARVPLVESGTAGHLGQVTVHLRSAGGAGAAAADPARPAPDPGRDSECYECAPKPAPKTYPVCTIRNTPDKPVHCIVWAKDLLFTRLFGKADAVTDLDEEADKGEAGGGGGGAAAAGPSTFLRGPDEAPAAYAARVFDRVFTTDVARAAAMEDLWAGVQGGEGAPAGKGGRAPPSPLDRAALVPPSTAAADAAAVTADPSTSARGVAKTLGLADPHATWSPADCARVFLAAVAAFHAHRAADVGSPATAWDKDDALAVDFVTAASNLRSNAYAIPPLSAFDAKGVAGNVIHAVATTNAIVAGLVTAEAVKLLAGDAAACRVTWLVQQAATGRLLVPTALPPPSPGCAVCGAATLECAIDCEATTLATLVDAVLKAGLGLVAPSISTVGGFLYEEGEGLDEDEVAGYAALRPRALAALPGGGLGHATAAAVTDQATDLALTLVLAHRADWDEPDVAAAHPGRFALSGRAPTAGGEGGRKRAASGSPPAAAATSSDGGVVAVVEEEDVAPRRAHKRARSAEGGGGGA